MKEMKIKLQVDSQATLKFYQPRPVPYSQKTGFEKGLDRLESEGVIENWAPPIVPVVKPNGSIRICGDYKLTVNPAAKVETYPLPRIEDIFASQVGSSSCQEAQKLTVVNTHKGQYKYRRMPFGITSAPAMFQRTVETILQAGFHLRKVAQGKLPPQTAQLPPQTDPTSSPPPPPPPRFCQYNDNNEVYRGLTAT